MSSAYQDAAAAQDAERIAGQIARALRKAARATDASTRRMQHDAGGRRGGARMPVTAGRTRRAPGTASQFHLHAKKSKASGTGKAPVSSVNKIKYDLGLDEKDIHADRVKIAFVSAPVGTPNAARDPLAMAAACEERARQSKYANSNTGQMLHLDAALPNSPSPDRLARLAGDINQKISDCFKVPAYSGVHLDHGNFHIHSSVPLYEVLDDGAGGFTLGDRIAHAKRPSEREALGLPRSPAGELRQLRQDIADLIADALAEEHPDALHVAERWRHGHRTLPQQVEQAAQRGDVDFVLDNLNRSATRKEGPGGFSKSNPHRDAAVAYNKEAGKTSSVPAPELITKTLANRVIGLARKSEIDSPEGFRMLARDHGLSVHWSAAKNGEGVQGVTFAVAGGPRIAGRQLGASLGVLQKKLRWHEKPKYRRFAPNKGDEFEDYQTKISEAGIKPADINDKAIELTIQRLAKLEAEAHANAPAEAPIKAPAATAAPLAEPAKPQPVRAKEADLSKPRPKRKSNDPSYNKKTTPRAASTGRTPASGQAAPATTPTRQEKSMNVDKLLSELQSIPEPPPVLIWMPKQPPTAAGASAGAAKGKHTAPRAIDPAKLTPHQRNLLAQEWNTREAQRASGFDGPLTLARERIERLHDDLRKRLQAEPWPAEEERKRFMRRTVMMETEEHRLWNEGMSATRIKIETLEKQIAKMIDAATQDDQLLSALPDLEAKYAAEAAERLDEVRRNQERTYADALERLARPGSHDRTAAQGAIKRLTDDNPDIAARERQRRAEVTAEERKRHHSSTSAPTRERFR